MRILLVHNRYRSASPSGEDRVVDQEHAALVEAGHTVQRFERFSDDIAGFSPVRKALVPANVIWNPDTGRAIDVALDEFEPDVVHAHNLFPLISPAILTACQRKGIPSVVTFHNYRPICPSGTLFRDGRPCRLCVDQRVPVSGIRHGCYRDSPAATVPIAIASTAQRTAWRTLPSAYIFLSDGQRREMDSLGLPIERCFVKPNFVLPNHGPRQAEPLVVYTGRFTEAKGVGLLMRAWDRFRASRPESGLRLAIAGSGPLEADLERWARTTPSVELPGLLDRDACEALVRRARAVIAPSEWPEPFGLVVPEAMAAGVPPIAAAHGSFVDLVDDGVDGLLYQPGSAAALAERFGQVDDDPALFDQLGQEAKRTFARRFGASTNVAELEAIYRFAVAHRRDETRARRATISRPTPKAGRNATPKAASMPPAPAAARPAAGNVAARPAAGHVTEMGTAASEGSVAAFWESQPCGDWMVGGLAERYHQDYTRFFEDYDRFRYGMESHIPGCLDRLDLQGKRVLEIGLGQGAESEQLIRRGAVWTGLDLTEEAVGRVRTRLDHRGLPYEGIIRGSAVDIPVADDHFDLVFSHGVLHHVPDILSAQREIHRVLRPDGRLVAMLYARHSLNYWVSIAVLRRAAVLAAAPLPRAPGGLLGDHLANARREGLFQYLRLERFTHANTDGPDNPFARVYDRRRVEQDFPLFALTGSRKWFMHAPPLPVHRLPGAKYLGWHLWVELTPKAAPCPAHPVPAADDVDSGATDNLVTSQF